MKIKMTFEEWFYQVDVAVDNATGCSVHDLPDMDYMSMFEDGVKPSAAAKRAIRNTNEG
jgi:hypothetical protein